MKNVKVLIVIWAMVCASMLSAQEQSIDLFTVPLSDPDNPGKLVVGQISGSIDVIAYSGKEVIVKAMITEDSNEGCKGCGSKSDKKGMKRISNASVNIGAEEEGNTVRINNELWNKKTDLFIKVPSNFALKLKTINNGDIHVEGVNGAMEISNVNGHITLENVSGSVIANTTNGVLKVDFNTITVGKEMAFSSFNGDVEVVFPKSLKAAIKAKSDMGDVYTDFDMAIVENKPVVDRNQSSGKYKVKVEQWVKGTINGGGPEMLFKTFNGDIMIKSK
ncbi:MAG: DUF4097 family beta strand repeat-containing protein [Bacteroidota bacterium]